jgi:CheY-like chemotaxis protein
MSLPDLARMLVVDDDEADVALIREALDAHRVPSQVHIGRDGVEALQYLRAAVSAGPRPDMILLDLNMPRMDGREMLRGEEGSGPGRHPHRGVHDLRTAR